MKRFLVYVLVLCLFTGAFNTANAQLNPLSSQYFLNTYLSNSSLAGTDTVLTVFLSHRKQFYKFPGSPVTQNLTATYGFKKVGIGLNINSEKAGLQRQTKAVGTFAYHVRLNEKGQKLSFGLSFGFMNQSLNTEDINGNPSDLLIGDYNNRETYLEGDFGLAYEVNNLTAEAAIPNLRTFFTSEKNSFSNTPTFYTALSYKITVSGKDNNSQEIALTPKVVYRGIRGFDNLWDGGLQATFAAQQVQLIALYHSNESATFGAALNFKRKYIISGMYNTNAKALSNYTSGGFELNLGLRL